MNSVACFDSCPRTVSSVSLGRHDSRDEAAAAPCRALPSSPPSCPQRQRLHLPPPTLRTQSPMSTAPSQGKGRKQVRLGVRSVLVFRCPRMKEHRSGPSSLHRTGTCEGGLAAQGTWARAWHARGALSAHRSACTIPWISESSSSNTKPRWRPFLAILCGPRRGGMGLWAGILPRCDSRSC
jgi:hypothetical protein